MVEHRTFNPGVPVFDSRRGDLCSDGREADGSGLENRRGEIHRGFKSLSLRVVWRSARLCFRPATPVCKRVFFYAGVAQLVVQRICNPSVVGSSPIASSSCCCGSAVEQLSRNQQIVGSNPTSSFHLILR